MAVAAHVHAIIRGRSLVALKLTAMGARISAAAVFLRRPPCGVVRQPPAPVVTQITKITQLDRAVSFHKQFSVKISVYTCCILLSNHIDDTDCGLRVT